ncbi:hypothetical protein GALL_478030 [mine drainage metagenome]|uniref:Uncharacterized protein n=1 Tax=mine drainage metagenome TaxID=410659 RepID=A0A1J5PS68_9ZZZZ
MFAQRAARLLVQRFDILCHVFARQHAHRLDHAEGKTTRHAGQGLVPAKRQQGFKLRRDLAVDEVLQTATDLFDHVVPGLVVHEGLDKRFERVGPRDQLADGGGAPHQAPLLGEIKLCVRRVVETIRPQMEFWFQRLHGGLAQGARLVRGCTLVLTKPEPFKTANEFALYRHFALVVHLGHEGLLLLQTAHQYRCAPVDKSLGQTSMQRIRQAVFYSARLVAPMTFVIYPAATLCDISPCANIRQSFRDCVDIAISAVDARNRRGKPVGRDAATIMHKVEDAGQQRCVLAA